ncbi:MAG: helix-turn-helix domain-containing protein [Ekhidna sp.]
MQYEINKNGKGIEAILKSILKEALQELIESAKQSEPSVSKDRRLTRLEVIESYKISSGTLHKIMREGDLAYEKVGRKTLFKSEDVENYFLSRRKGDAS